MILLFLGLAYVLAKGTSLLVDYDSMRGEDEDRDESRFFNKTPYEGEIAGSCSVTTEGDVWLTIFIDEISVFAKLEVIERNVDPAFYRFSIIEFEYPKGTAGCTSPHILPLTAGNNRMVEFRDPVDASNKIIQMFDKMGIVIRQESLKSIPYAIYCGWRSPDECKNIVANLIKDNSNG